MKQELSLYNVADAENLLEQIKSFFMSKGIIAKKFSFKSSETKQSADDDFKVIKQFFIHPDATAFYLKLNSPDDIDELNMSLEMQIKNLQDKLNNFLRNNSELDGDLREKIETFASSNLMKAKKAIKFGLTKSLKQDSKECNSISELHEASGRRYGEFFQKEILERIVYPIYDGLRQNPADDVYRWVLQEINVFLSELGIYTVNISVGDKYDENSPYVPAEESRSEKYITTSLEQKDSIKKILRYAYAFNEGKVTDNRQIDEGEVIVMVYRAEDAE